MSTTQQEGIVPFPCDACDCKTHTLSVAYSIYTSIVTVSQAGKSNLLTAMQLYKFKPSHGVLVLQKKKKATRTGEVSLTKGQKAKRGPAIYLCVNGSQLECYTETLFKYS